MCKVIDNYMTPSPKIIQPNYLQPRGCGKMSITFFSQSAMQTLFRILILDIFVHQIKLNPEASDSTVLLMCMYLADLIDIV